MRYWDASAVVPLIVREATTPVAHRMLEADMQPVTWVWTIVEVTSAIERRSREGHLDLDARRTALDRLRELEERWDLVDDAQGVRQRATLLLGRHALRAADAGQLGAATVLMDLGITDLPFVTFDVRLALAAEREGLRVLAG